MSRVGQLPIKVPQNVKVEIRGKEVTAEGPKGKLEFKLPDFTQVKIDQGVLSVTRENDSAKAKAFHGLSRAIINNMVSGVHAGFEKKLEIHGVGFKASVSGAVVSLSLGYSHTIEYKLPPQIKVTVENATKVAIQGPSKEDVGRVAAEIRSFYPPEPYKGKGVRYLGERVVRKEGKTVQ